MIRQRLFSFGMVLSVGFLLLVLLILSAALAYMGRAFAQLVTLPPFVMQTINFLVSFVVIAGLFGLMFKYVPAAKIPWKDVLVGAVGTAVLFTIGKQLLGQYLGKASVGSTYGAAGSLVAVVVWIYYSAQIFFFGAEFTHVYAEARRVGNQPQQRNQPYKRPRTIETAASRATRRSVLSMAARVGLARMLAVPTASAPVSAQATQRRGYLLVKRSGRAGSRAHKPDIDSL